MRPPVILAGLCLGLLAAPLWAQDAAPAPSPAARAAEVRRALPAPSPEAGFSFEADILVEGARLGTATYAARPGAAGTDVPWEVLETADIPGAEPAKARRHATRAVLEPDLRLRTYERTVSGREAPIDRTRVAWGEAGRLDVVRTDAAGHETRTSPEADRAATATLAGLVLFLRHVPGEPAVYELPIFVHETGSVRAVRIEVAFPPAAPAEASLVASVAMGDWTIEVDLAAADRRPRRITQSKGDVVVVFATRGPGPALEPVDATKPASTAREPGVRFLVGLMTGDEALVAAAFHWPSLLASEKARSGFEGDEAALRRDVLGRLKAAYQALPRAEAEHRARAAAAAASEEPDGDRVRVRFGEPLAKLVYAAKRIDGAWYAVEMLPVPAPR